MMMPFYKGTDQKLLSACCCFDYLSLNRIHDLPRIPGSYLLEGAAEPLYMGGNVDIASERLIQQKNVDPKAHFKFFWKAKVWAPGKLEDELEQGLWKATGPLSANQAFLL